MINLLFSIIVPIYNVDIYLKDCIESILNQSYTSFELILVDDGSTDKSPNICDYYKDLDSRIKVIHKSNGGLVSARKAGVEIAKGDYALCVDSDDWIHKDHLLSLYNVITEYSPEIICFDYFEVYENSTFVKKNPFRKGFYSKEQMIKEIFPSLIETDNGKCFPPCIWGKAYKLDLYKNEQLCVDDRIKIGEDVACTIPCLFRADSIYVLDKSLYYYRRNNISMTKNKKPFLWDVPEYIDTHLRNRLDTTCCDFDLQISRRTVHALINVVKTQFYMHKNYREIIREIKQKLDNTVYSKAISNCRFLFLSPVNIFYLCLKYKFIFPIYILSKLR